MIGFEDEPESERGHAGEADDTRKLTKKDFYKMLDKVYFMPPLQSRGMHRPYLLKVHNALVFRIKQSDLRHFEVDLTPEMSKRTGPLNNCLLVRKVNFFLRSQNKVELGFDEFDPPEEVASSHQTGSTRSCGSSIPQTSWSSSRNL